MGSIRRVSGGAEGTNGFGVACKFGTGAGFVPKFVGVALETVVVASCGTAARVGATGRMRSSRLLNAK